MPVAKLVALLTPKRRWAQFSLASMFVLVTVLCVGLAVQVNRANRRRDAVEAIKVWGGWLEYDHELGINRPWLLRDRLRVLFGDDDAAHVVHVSLPSNWETMHRKFEGTFTGQSHVTSGPVVDDVGLRKVVELGNLQHLSLAWIDITDAGLANLQGLTNLRSLDLHYTNVTDDGVKVLEGMRYLDSLYLAGTQIGDRGLASLRPLKNLRALSLHTSSVTGAGIEHLAGLAKLKSLDLSYTKVGDDGLDNLAKLTSFGHLDIRYTAISAAGHTRLLQAMPNCSISGLSD